MALCLHTQFTSSIEIWYRHIHLKPKHDVILYEVISILMGHDATARVESVRERVVSQIGDVGRIDIGEAEQASREVGGVVVSSEHAAELGVKHRLDLVPGIEVNLLHEAWNNRFQQLVHAILMDVTITTHFAFFLPKS